MTVSRMASWVLLVAVVGACGAPPSAQPRSEGNARTVGKRRTDIPDDCADVAGKPAEPLRIAFSGAAKTARCQREVYTIMGGLTHFLGVECRHCHLEPDYAADTHNKHIANWMARELVPRLQKRAAGAGHSRDVWCQDCHAGRPKFLGDPRRRDFAIEWMTTHLTEDFSRAGNSPGASNEPPRCKDCHGGDLGSPAFRFKIILTDLATGAPMVEPAPSPLPELGEREH